MVSRACGNFRLTPLINKIAFKGLKAVAAQISYAILTILFTAQTAIKIGKTKNCERSTFRLKNPYISEF